MKKTKQILSIMLALVMLATSLISVNISALAEDLFKNAEVIDLNSSIEASGEGYFKTTTTENGILNIVFAHDQVDEWRYYWDITLYQKDKYGTYSELQPSKHIMAEDESPESFTKMMVEPITVYIKVVPFSTNQNTYRIFSEFEQTYGDYETENNDTYNTADVIPLNSSIIGSTWDGDNKDWYSITTTENGTLDIEFCHSYINDSSSWDVTLYMLTENGSIKELQQKADILASDGNYSFLTMGLRPGVYYIEVDTYWAYNMDYVVANTFTPIVNNEYEAEFNNSVENANELNLNSSVKANGWDYHDNDWYHIKTTEKGKLDIEFLHNYENDSSAWEITIYALANNGTLKELQHKNELHAWDENYKFSSMGLEPGDYYILVDASWTGKYEYILKNTFTPIKNNEYETESNNTFDSADKINLNSSITANAYGNDEYDYYKITTTKHGNLKLDLLCDRENKGATWSVKVYTKNKKVFDELCSFEVRDNNNSNSTATIKGLNAGTYYIEVNTHFANVSYVRDDVEYKIQNKLTHTHSYKVSSTVKATTTKNGKINYVCPDCDATKSKTIDSIKSVALSKSSYVYDGKAKKPTVTVKNSKGNKISSKYYTVAYQSGRKNVGKYTVKITFKGNYSGTVKKTFVIKPKATSISDVTAKSKAFTVKWNKLTTQTTGYQIQYSTSSKFTSPKVLTVGSNKTTSKKISNLKAKKKYYVRVRTYKTVNGTKYYSSWSKYKAVTTKK